MLKYTANVRKVDTAWASLEEVAAGLPLPPRFAAAMDKAKQGFSRGATSSRCATKTEDAGRRQKPDKSTHAAMDRRLSVPKLATLLGVAEAALDVAKEHAAAQRASATDARRSSRC